MLLFLLGLGSEQLVSLSLGLRILCLFADPHLFVFGECVVELIDLPPDGSAFVSFVLAFLVKPIGPL